jgi:hypothetical protein
VSVFSELGGFLGILSGVFFTLHIMLFGSRDIRIAYEKFSVRNEQEEDERTSQYLAKN